MSAELQQFQLGPKVGRALQALARAARARRLYHANNASLVRANDELLAAFADLLKDVEHVSVKVRPDAFVHAGERVFEESRSTESLPFVFYREGVRRLDFSKGLEPKEIDALVEATISGMAFTGLGDDLVSVLWRHDLEHFRYLAVDTAIVDAALGEEQGPAGDVEATINDLLRSIYGAGAQDVGPRSIHVDISDFSAKTIAEQLSSIDEMAPGFHPARALIDLPRWAATMAAEVAAEVDHRLVARVMFCAAEALATGQVAGTERELLATGILRMFDSALVEGHLRQAGRILASLQAVLRFPDAAADAEALIQAAVEEARLRPVITAHAASSTPEAFPELATLVRTAGPSAVPALLSALPSIEDPARRRTVADLALEVGIVDGALVRSLLGSALSYVAQEALYLLKHLPTAMQLEVASSCLDDPDLKLVALGARVVGVVGGPDAEALLMHHLEAHELGSVPASLQRALLDALALVTQSRGIGYLVRRLSKADSDTVPQSIEDGAVAATLALRLVRTQGAIAALKKAAVSPHPRVRIAARETLQELKTGHVSIPTITLESEVAAAEDKRTGFGGINLGARFKGGADRGAPVHGGQSSDLASAAAAAKTTLSAKAIELGRNFLSALFMGIRTAQIHDTGNRAFESGLAQVRESADALFSATNGFSIQFVEETAFLNGTRLRFEGRGFETMRTLKAILGSHGLGGIQMRSPPTYDAVKRLVLLFAPNNATRGNEELTKEGLAAVSIELLGIRHFSDDEQAEMVVDRRVFAVQSYAKLILAWREQHQRAERELTGAPEPTDDAPPKVRAVRVIQDLVELSGDRLDLLLRLASNHRGGGIDELHAANTCVLGIAMGHALGFPRQDLVDIGVAALFHDLAAGADRSAKAKANGAFARMLSSGGLARSLQLRAVMVGEEPVTSGEPSAFGRPRADRHPYSMLLSVVKTYDGLTGGKIRPDERPVHALDALAEMGNDGTGRIEPRFVEVLINVLRAYPKGVRVVLESGEEATVRTQLGSSRWDRPIVRVEGPKARQIDLMTKQGDRYTDRIVEAILGDLVAPAAAPTDDLHVAPAPAEVVVTEPPPLEVADEPEPLELTEPDAQIRPLVSTEDIPEPLPLDLQLQVLDVPSFWAGTRFAELEEERGVRATEVGGRALAFPTYWGALNQDGSPVLIKAHDRGAIDDPRLPAREWSTLFMREGQLAFGVDHPGLPRLLAATTIVESSYLVYQWPHSVPLGQLLGTVGLEVTQIAKGLAEILAHMHGRGLLCANVALDQVWIRDDGGPLLADLSFASPIGGPLHPLLRFNRACLCPELIERGVYDVRSEQYALGTVLYQMLTGVHPLDERDTQDLSAGGPIPGPASLRPDVDPTLAEIIERLLASDPAHRFASFGELIRRLG